ncbi:MAG TPA: AraC family transcriptional regulator [Gammaproteobacteria bacterium]|jgi:AraC-like DNA-binding protein|nr:AraC family transcriptional regulator [Gammaproteobacteria bacterium]
MKYPSQKISVAELKRGLETYPATTDDVQNSDDAIIDSELLHKANYGGLSMYAVRHTELSDMSVMVELPAAISFNITFEGSADISLGGIPYQIQCDRSGGPRCCAYVLNRPELFIRYLRKHSTVAHLNVFAERQWLEARAHAAETRNMYQRLFQQHSILHFWQPSTKTIDLAKALFSAPPTDSFTHAIRHESLTLELLAQGIDELERLSTQIQPDDNAHITNNRADVALKKTVDDLLLERYSISDIAASLGLSTSTLQRRFKTAFGITVDHYCRQRRLENARRALTIDGVSIGEAAYLAGYNHTSNFLAAFKKRFRMTPSELMKQGH